MNRIMGSCAIIALLIASFVAVGMMADESDAGGHAYYDIDLGDRILEVGQTMEIDLADKMEMLNWYEGGSFSEMVISSDAPSWIEVIADVGESLTRDSDIRLVLSPSAISSGEYTIVFDTVRTQITSVTMITFTVTLKVISVASSSQGDAVNVTFDPVGGFADFSSLSCIEGFSMMLPGAELPGYIFEGWYDGDVRVGGAGDSFTVTEGMVLSAVWEPDPEYVAPGTYDWVYSTVIIGVIVAIAAIVIIRGRA